MPNDGRDISGWLYSRDRDHALSVNGDHFGIGGKSAHTGRLIFLHGADPGRVVAGKTEIPRWEWQQVVFVRDDAKVRAYLNGRLEFEAEAPAGALTSLRQSFLGGRSDHDSSWEGRLDEVAVFDRALTSEEVAKLAK